MMSGAEADVRLSGHALMLRLRLNENPERSLLRLLLFDKTDAVSDSCTPRVLRRAALIISW
jgi:hypothetical protein